MERPAMARFTKLLQELEFMPAAALDRVSQDTPGAAYRMAKALADADFTRSVSDNLAKGRKAVAALPAIKAEAKAFKANMARMIKSIQVDQAAGIKTFAKAQAIAAHN